MTIKELKNKAKMGEIRIIKAIGERAFVFDEINKKKTYLDDKILMIGCLVEDLESGEEIIIDIED